MSRRIVLGVFEAESDVLAATNQARASGLTIVDVFTPYPVHGLDDAMKLRASRLPWLCFFAAVAGAGLKLWFEFWTMTESWPVNVGGKPWNSLPAYVPVTFEVMVLSAGLATVFVFLILSGLRPGKRPALIHDRVTDDRFVLVLEESNAQFDLPSIRRLLQRHGALEVEERLEAA